MKERAAGGGGERSSPPRRFSALGKPCEKSKSFYRVNRPRNGGNSTTYIEKQLKYFFLFLPLPNYSILLSLVFFNSSKVQLSNTAL
jgi:hypothetical protein